MGAILRRPVRLLCFNSMHTTHTQTYTIQLCTHTHTHTLAHSNRGRRSTWMTYSGWTRCTLEGSLACCSSLRRSLSSLASQEKAQELALPLQPNAQLKAAVRVRTGKKHNHLLSCRSSSGRKLGMRLPHPTQNRFNLEGVCVSVCVRRHSWWSGSVGQLVGLQC